MANANGNNEYKSDVFSMLLQEKWRALEVYNAINGTAYDDPEQVELTTLENRSFSLTVRNDASFILNVDLPIPACHISNEIRMFLSKRFGIRSK